MSICKYCGNPIEGEPVMNPDEYGNGYHHFCLVDKEFRERDKSIFQKGYDKGKADVLDEIRAEINSPNRGTCDYRIEEIIDKYRAESEG
jgi:hypothetical protein